MASKFEVIRILLARFLIAPLTGRRANFIELSPRCKIGTQVFAIITNCKIPSSKCFKIIASLEGDSHGVAMTKPNLVKIKCFAALGYRFRHNVLLTLLGDGENTVEGGWFVNGIVPSTIVNANNLT